MGIRFVEVQYNKRRALFHCCGYFPASFLELARHTRMNRNKASYTTVICPYCQSQATFPLFDKSNKPAWTIRGLVEYDNLTIEERVALRLMG